MITNHHTFLLLIKHFHPLGYQAHARFLVQFLFGNRNFYFDGIPYKNRFYKTQPVVPITECHFIYKRSRHPNSYTKNQSAVCYSLFEGLRFAPFGIHMMREKITCLAGMHYNIGFGYGAPNGFTAAAFNIIFEKDFGKQEEDF